MKRGVKLAAALAIMLAVMMPGAGAERAAGRILVLGFQSNFLDDIQDRIFREMLIRKFQEKGLPVVQVMELESAIQTDHPPDIRNVDSRIASELCEEFGASFAVCGKINRVKKAKKAGVDEYDYTFEAAMFSMRGQSFSRTIMKGTMAQDMEQFLDGLASDLVERLGPRVAPSGK